MRITKIVITGGPCGGKSTAMSWIQNAFSEKGYGVLFIPETATELISGGAAPWTCGSNLEFQKCQMELQMEKERIFEQAARSMDREKVLIVCDRGALDNKAYMTEEEFRQTLEAVHTNEVQLRDSYDAVFHLVTAAKGAREYYTTANNTARKESPEEAASLDDKLISAWTGHPHFRMIDNSTGFEDKLRRLIAEINSFLGEPEPLEIKRKFLIQYPDIQWLESNPNCRRVEIIQTYLKSGSGNEVRVRQRGSDGNFIYFKTTRRRTDSGDKVEIEQRLTQEEYLSALMDADTSRRQIRKTRYCLTWQNQYFEIDVYPFWSEQAIVEIDLRNREEEIFFPEKLKVIREVTGEAEYETPSLSKQHGNQKLC